MQTIERDPRVDSQTAAVAGSEARSRTPLNDRIAARRTEDQRADSRLNSGFPLLAPGHNQPVIRTETWSLSTRDDQVGGAVICFAVTALTLPLAVILNPGLLWVWVFVGPVLLVAGIAQLINPYEVEIVPSGALRFISVTKTDEFSCAEVRRIVRQENRSNHTLRQFRVDHAGRVAIVHGVKAEPLYQRLLKLPTLTPAVQVSVEEYDDSD